VPSGNPTSLLKNRVDEGGNIILILQSITWNVENMPATISDETSTVSFFYDGDGNRVIKVENGEVYTGGGYQLIKKLTC